MTTCNTDNISEKQNAFDTSAGFVHSFETLGALDGPGMRTVVFLSGCHMRCAYCHNPDTWEMKHGNRMSTEEVMRRIRRYKPYFGKNGGITLSGGEPLLQAKFASEIFRLCHKEGIHTALDTAGSVVNSDVSALLDETDLVILDIKHTDANEFHSLTQYSMEHVMEFLTICFEKKKTLWLRQVIVPQITDKEENILAFRALAERYNAKRTELLPYHTHGVFKWEKLGLSYSLAKTEPPDENRMKELNRILHNE